MKWLLSVSWLLFSCSCLANTLVSGDSLLLRIRFAKPSYLTGEELYLDLFLINTTDRKLYVLSPWDERSVVYVCHDEDGKIIPPTVSLSGGYLGPPDLRCILPRDSLWWWVDVPGNGYKALSSRGVFSFQAIYNGRHFSNEERCQVIEPSGKEKEVYEEVRKAAAGIDNPLDMPRLTKAEAELEKIISCHPQSVYAPKCLKLLQDAYRGRTYLRLTNGELERRKVVEIGKRFVSSYPNSHECMLVFFNICDMMTPEQGKGYLEQVVSSKKGTLAARFAERLLGDKNEVSTPRQR